MMTMFWDIKGSFFSSFTHKFIIYHIVNSASYCEFLKELKPKFKFKRCLKVSKVVFLLQDNVWPCKANKMILWLQDIGYELFYHLPHSPEPSPNDFQFSDN